ncbi:MAG: S8 family serine peptidase [Bacteroidia bacterium]|nr:S8 family serine peptidase [Bacteroidia bacterium]
MAKIKKILLVLAIVAGTYNLQAQGKIKVSRFWVELKDKGGKANRFDTSRPYEFLSSRSIERRAKNNVRITMQDIPVNMSYVYEMAIFPGTKVLNISKWFNAVTIEVYDSTTIEKIKALNFVSGVRYLGKGMVPDPSLVITKTPENISDALLVPFDLTPVLSFKNTDYGKGTAQITMLNGKSLHDMGFSGQGVFIAVIDAGFRQADRSDVYRQMFSDKRMLAAVDFVEHDGDVYNDDNHGMNVLSCMASYIPGKMVGTAPAASYFLLRSEQSASEFPVEEANWVSAAEYADSAGVDVINSSLGYNIFDDPALSYHYGDLNGKTSIISRAATIASSKGIIICNSAGNDGESVWHYIGMPADAENIISVGGVDVNASHASFSSYGPTSDGRIKPTVCAMAENTAVASVNNSVYGSNGTSFSSPVLAGMVACLVQANPNKTSQEIMDAINKSSSHYNMPDNNYGFGIPDFYIAHTILGGNNKFDYTKDQLIPLTYSTGFSKFFVRYYSVKSQEVTITLSYTKKNGKIKRKTKMAGHADAGSFFNSPFIFNYMTNKKKVKKLKAGTYVITVKTDTATFTQNFSYTPEVKN